MRSERVVPSISSITIARMSPDGASPLMSTMFGRGDARICVWRLNRPFIRSGYDQSAAAMRIMVYPAYNVHDHFSGGSLKDIESIISELEQQRSAIDRAILALREVTGTRPPGAATASPPREAVAGKKRTITPAGRKKIAEAMRRRWAEKRGLGQGSNAIQPSQAGQQRDTAKKRPAKKRRLSAEGRKRIIEATKRRWAAKRVAQQNSGAPQQANPKSRTRKKTAA
jgi:hypothetical protein